MTDFAAFAAEYNGKIEAAVGAIGAEWALTGYRGHNTRDGVAWVARLRHNGKSVARVQQDGRGGDTFVDFVGGWRSPKATEWASAVSEHAGGSEDVALEALLRRAGR